VHFGVYDSLYNQWRQANKYVGPPYCRAEMYAGRVAAALMVSRGAYADGTYRQTN